MTIVRALCAFLFSAFCLQGCGFADLRTRAAEDGFRRDVMALGEVVNFRHVKFEEKDLPEGPALLVDFVGEVRWFTPEEAAGNPIPSHDPGLYASKLKRLGFELDSGTPAIGSSQAVKGRIRLLKNDGGWFYGGLTRRFQDARGSSRPQI